MPPFAPCLLLLGWAMIATVAPSRATNLAALISSTPAGGVLELPKGYVFRLSSPIVITRPITIEGQGDLVVVADGSKIAGAVISSSGVDYITISDLRIDANVDRDGANYGVWLTGGMGQHIIGLNVSNTSQSCILLQDSSGTIEDNTVARCGRSLTIEKGTASNNHGIMVASIKSPVSNVTIRGNIVQSSRRKCITTYSRGNGSLSNISILNNKVENCGLGGIYIANAPQAIPQTKVFLAGNISLNSYVGFQIDDVVGLTMNENIAENDDKGGSGLFTAQGLILNNVKQALVKGMLVKYSGSGGILVRNSEDIILEQPVVIDPNMNRNAFGPGIHFSNTRNSEADAVTVIDDRIKPGVTHGFIENDGSSNNSVTIKKVKGTDRKIIRISSSE